MALDPKFGNINPQEIQKDPFFRRLNDTDLKNELGDGSNLMYPLDLLSDPETQGGHFVLFNINETNGIRFESTKKTTNLISRPQDDPNLDEAGDSRSFKETVDQYFSNVRKLSSSAVQKIQENNTSKYSIYENSSRSDKLISRQNTAHQGRVRRLKDSIVLYMPDNVSVSYGVDYSEEDLTVAGTAVKSSMDFFNLVTKGQKTDSTIKQALAIAAARGVNYTAGAFDAVAGIVGIDANTENYIKAYSKAVLNPHMEFLFRSVNARTFEYSFTFAPRSQRESEEVDRIIRLFKYHAHPSISPGSGGSVLNYPSEFDISYFSNMKENLYLNRILSCALTGISINYTPQGVLSFFHESNPEKGKAPTQIQITLSFQELGILNRDLVDQGF